MRALSALLLMAVVLPMNGAGAQGFQDPAFDRELPLSPRSASAYVRSPPGSGFSPYVPSPSFTDEIGRFADHAPQVQARPTTYRTMCVRMCDGFYFPISHATSSINFAHDAETCAASCGREARLFYYPNPGGDVAGMMDLAGRAYTSYPIAFKYRKTLVPGCQCRPQPWTDVERERHRSYAAREQVGHKAERAGPPPDDIAHQAKIEVLAREWGADQDLRAVVRPEPIDRQAAPRNWSFDAGAGSQTRSLYEWPAAR